MRFVSILLLAGSLSVMGQPMTDLSRLVDAQLPGLVSTYKDLHYVLGQHDDPALAAGSVGIVSDPILASSTSVDVTLRGVGGHGARPEATKDPIVMAAEYILELQTIVSRQIQPQEPAVVTVGTIHGGTKRNIIPDEVKLQLTIRAYSEPAREKIIDLMKK